MTGGAFAQTINLSVGDLKGLDQARFVAGVHRKLHESVLREQQARSGLTPAFRHVVDGRRDATLESVSRGGRIMTLYDYRREVVIFALAALQAASPVRSGRYQRAHFALVNDRRVSDIPKVFDDADRIIVTNDVPYARRLEVGKHGDGRAFVISVPPRIYERTIKNVIRPKYRNVAAIEFIYVDLANAYKLRRKGKRRQNRVGDPVRYPAVLIKAL